MLTAGRMVLMHPHQQTYFSYLPRPLVGQLFERDYWGVSYRQGLALLAAQHPTGPLVVGATEYAPLSNNAAWLAPADRARLVMVPRDSCRYLFTAYRSRLPAYADSVGREIGTVQADGLKILSIIERPKAKPVLPAR